MFCEIESQDKFCAYGVIDINDKPTIKYNDNNYRYRRANIGEDLYYCCLTGCNNWLCVQSGTQIIENNKVPLKKRTFCEHASHFTIKEHRLLTVQKSMKAHLVNCNGKQAYFKHMLAYPQHCELAHGFDYFRSCLYRQRDPELSPCLPTNMKEISIVLNKLYSGNYWSHERQNLVRKLEHFNKKKVVALCSDDMPKIPPELVAKNDNIIKTIAAQVNDDSKQYDDDVKTDNEIDLTTHKFSDDDEKNDLVDDQIEYESEDDSAVDESDMDTRWNRHMSSVDSEMSDNRKKETANAATRNIINQMKTTLQNTESLMRERLLNVKQIEWLLKRNEILEQIIRASEITDDFEERFYYGNNGNDRFQVFMSKSLVQLLWEHYHLQADGTFAITPVISKKAKEAYHPFDQVLTINAVINPQNMTSIQTAGEDRMSECLPCMFILVPGKKAVDYTEVLCYIRKEMKEMGFDFTKKPANAGDDFIRVGHCDFEKRLRYSLKKCFALERVKGCFAHFAGALNRNMSRRGLRKLLNDSREFRRAFAKLKCVALLPVRFKKDGLDYVRKCMTEAGGDEYKNKIDIYFDHYFIPTWWNGRYELQDWHWFLDKNRTTNLLEIKHKYYKEELGAHPQLFKFVEYIMKVAAKSTIRGRQLKVHGRTNIKTVKRRVESLLLKKCWDAMSEVDPEMNVETFLTITSLAIKEKTEKSKTLYREWIQKRNAARAEAQRTGCWMPGGPKSVRKQKQEIIKVNVRVPAQVFENVNQPERVLQPKKRRKLNKKAKQFAKSGCTWVAEDEAALLSLYIDDSKIDWQEASKTFERSPTALKNRLKMILNENKKH